MIRMYEAGFAQRISQLLLKSSVDETKTKEWLLFWW